MKGLSSKIITVQFTVSNPPQDMMYRRMLSLKLKEELNFKHVESLLEPKYDTDA